MTAPRRVRRLRHQRAAPAATTTTAATSSGKIVLALDHEPGERDPNSPFDGVVTSEPSTRVAQGAGGAGEGRGRRCCSSPTCTTIRARRTSRRRRATYWPEKPPRILQATRWPRGPIASAFRSRRSRRRSPQRSSPAPARTLDDLAKAAETAHGFTPLAAARRARRICAPPSIATSCRIATSSRCSRAAIRS